MPALVGVADTAHRRANAHLGAAFAVWARILTIPMSAFIAAVNFYFLAAIGLP